MFPSALTPPSTGSGQTRTNGSYLHTCTALDTSHPLVAKESTYDRPQQPRRARAAPSAADCAERRPLRPRHAAVTRSTDATPRGSLGWDLVVHRLPDSIRSPAHRVIAEADTLDPPPGSPETSAGLSCAHAAMAAASKYEPDRRSWRRQSHQTTAMSCCWTSTLSATQSWRRSVLPSAKRSRWRPLPTRTSRLSGRSPGRRRGGRHQSDSKAASFVGSDVGLDSSPTNWLLVHFDYGACQPAV